MVREPDATMQPSSQDNQLMSKRRVLSFKPQLRLEWRGQDGQSETEQPDHSASLGDSITSSTRIRFSVHTGAEQGSEGKGQMFESCRVRQERRCQACRDCGGPKSSSRGSFGIYTSNGHCLLNNRHGPTGGLDPVAIDPERTLDPGAMLTAPALFRSCSRFPICLHRQTGAGLFR
jgi:hypothetical protein